MVNGTLPVQGEGIVPTVANPLSVSGDNADSSPPEEGKMAARFESSPIPIRSCLSPCYGNPERRRSPRSTATALACRTSISNRRIDDSHRSQFGAKPISNRGDRQSGDLGEIGKQDNAVNNSYDDFKKAGIYPADKQKQIDYT